MQPQDNQPNTNPGISPNPETPPTPTPQAAATPTTEMPAPTNTVSTPSSIAEPAVNPVTESTDTTVQPATLTQAPADSYTKSNKSKSKLFIILGVVLVALAGIGFGVWYLFTNVLVPNKYGNIQLKAYEADSSFSVLAPSKEPTKKDESDTYIQTTSYTWEDTYDNSSNSRLKMGVLVGKIKFDDQQKDTFTQSLIKKFNESYNEEGVKKEIPSAKNIVTTKNTSSSPYWWSMVYEGEYKGLTGDDNFKAKVYKKYFLKDNKMIGIGIATEKAIEMESMAKQIMDSLKIN